MLRNFRFFLALLVLVSFSPLTRAQDERFDIRRFVVEGNTLLPPAQVDALVAPFAGERKVYGDIQKALEALENAYRSVGYGTVQVYVPEQELTHGSVRLQVTEGVIGKVTISGLKEYTLENIRRTLPQLQEGRAPNMRQISENILLANDNPAKQLEVTLGVGEADDTVDAKVNVTEDPIRRFTVSFDNTGSGSTGEYRVGVAYMNANLFDADQVLTLAYTTTPDAPPNVKVDVYSVAYRIPFYSIGDSVDVIYGKSSTNVPVVQSTGFNLAGKGDVLGLRWNHYFPRRGEYTSKLIYGFDYKYMNTRCTIAGVPQSMNPGDSLTASCLPYTLRPFTLTYSGQKAGAGEVIDYSLGVLRNFAMGSRYSYTSTRNATGVDHYSFINSNRQTPDSFMAVKGTLSYMKALPDNFALRLALNWQYSPSALPSGEQIGLAGSTAVRGFGERAVAMDRGWFGTAEIYSPELAPELGLPGSLKAVFFYDLARGYNLNTARVNPWDTPVQKAGIASVGTGLRYALNKDVSLRADFAMVTDAGPVDIIPGTISTTPSNTESTGDWRGHFGLQVSF
jgi:hemolysin activation/secretion protein